MSGDLLIITGASAGIGAATAELFHAAGWRVINLSRRPASVAGVESFPVDLARPETLDAVAEALVEAAQAAARVCLVHNAARHSSDTVHSLDAPTLRAILEINVVAPQRLNALLLPHMRPGSSVLYVGSTLSEKGVPGAFSYVTSKHAQVGMMRATSQDLAGTGVHSAAICPGLTDTALLRESRQHDPEVLAALAALSGFGRLIEPIEIARLLQFAAENPVIGGAVLHGHLAQREV